MAWSGLTCLAPLQVESFIPLWEWDIPKKKKKRGDKSDKGKAAANGEESVSTSPRVEEVVDSGDSRPSSRQARVEEVPDEDS